MNYRDRKSALLLLVFSVGLLIGSTAIFTGCTDPLSGDVNDNIRPTVEFINVPPGPWEEEFWTVDTIAGDSVLDSTVTRYTRFSRNPFVYWRGADRDGQIDYYRYKVITTLELDSAGLSITEYIDYLLSFEENWPKIVTTTVDTISQTEILTEVDTATVWTKYLDIDPTAGDPKTTEVVKLRAFNDDPVNVYQVQYVLVQAIDEEGGQSDVAVRAFSRNDNPPNTSIAYIPPDAVFINSETEGIITGVFFNWSAEDPDYPAGTNAPPFEYNWTLFGPFEDFRDGDSVFANVIRDYVYDVFVTADAKTYYPGDLLITCDTSFDQGGLITCDTFLVGTDNLSSVRGRWQEEFDHEAIRQNPDFADRVPWESSGWTNDSSLALYNVFKDYNFPPGGDTTVEMNFIFWVDSRDDAGVRDPIPSFKAVRVINPRHERAVLVLDFSRFVTPAFNQPNNPPAPDRNGMTRRWMKNMIDNWGSANVPGWDLNSSFDITLLDGFNCPDYILAKSAANSSGVPIRELLKHNVIVLYNDAVERADYTKFEPVFRAIDAGTNVWAMMRCPFVGLLSNDVIDTPVTSFPAGGSDYSFYFAASTFSFSAWMRHYFDGDGKNPYTIPRRIEDFTYADPLESKWTPGFTWPELTIDTSLLHANYVWEVPDWQMKWIPDTAALPEVNWMSFRQSFTEGGIKVEAEPMYLYGSKYGAGAFGPYQGSPVAHRVRGDYFKTVHMSFTPLAFPQDDFQPLADSVLNYLFVPRVY